MEERTRPASKNDELQLLDCLGTDFVYLRRFILATHQMARMLRTELARGDFDIQEKMISTMEIAKETLGEAGVSARPFVPCPANLLPHREAYFDMLNVARGLVPYIKDAEVRLRLRRLLLPLSSTSRFRVSLHNADDIANDRKEQAPLTTWWDAPTASSSSSSSDVGRQSIAPVEQNSPSKKMKLTMPSSQRHNRGIRATTPSPSSPSAARSGTNTALVSQRTRADAISSDVSQRGLVKRATQTVMSKSTTPSPIRISSPLPKLTSSLSLSPSPSPSPSPPPSITTSSPFTSPSKSQPHYPLTPSINDPSIAKPGHTRSLGPGYEAAKGSEVELDWEWFTSGCMNWDGSLRDPSKVVFGGSWASLKYMSHEDFMAMSVPCREYAEPGAHGGVS